MSITTEKELAEAIKREDSTSTIEIEGDLVKKVIRIRATGKVAWVIVIGAISVVVYSVIATMGTGGASTPVSVSSFGFSAPVAVGILGVGATYSAIAIAVGAGSIGVLTSLRGYKEISRSENKLILKKS